MNDPFSYALHLIAAPPVAFAQTDEGHAALASPALAAVIRERIEQVEKHGYSAEHDAGHDGWEIAHGALAYLCAGLSIEIGDSFAGEDAALSAAHLDQANGIWPWQRELFRPADYYTCLIKAAAMILAEADRVLIAQSLIEQLRP